MDRNKCPICKGISLQVYEMKQPNSGTAKWHHCACGAIFNNLVTAGNISDAVMKEFDSNHEIRQRVSHYVNTYVPLVEEYAACRRFTWHGYCNFYFQNAMIDRGWVHDPDSRKSDFIFSLHELQHKLDIKRYLKDCFDALTSTGCLLIATPDTDFVHVLGPSNWGNWDCKASNVYLNIPRLKRELENVGFEVVLALQNTSYRFVYMNDMHLIARKKIL